MTDGLRVVSAIWPHERLDALLVGGDVLVCSASLGGAGHDVARALEVLSVIERERYERHENGDVARRFALGRLHLREMLGGLLGVHPAMVPIHLGLHGKPALARAAQSSGLRFSVAHCEELLLVAVTRLGDVGIDVERVRPIERWARVADRMFSSDERAAMDHEIANGDDPTSAFFRFWCRGEAELKAIGCGISGLGAHREGWHPAGLRVAELASVPLPEDLETTGARYQAAVALCTPRDPTTFRTPTDTTQLRPPRITPTSASTA